MNINEKLASIDYYVNDANMRVNNAMIALEHKELSVDECNNQEIYVERFVDKDLDFNVVVEAWADYDFTGHNSYQGERNLSFAKALCQIIEASDDYHRKSIDGGRSKSSIQMNGKAANNTLKYEKLGQLIRSYSMLNPNYAKLTVVSEDLGKDPKSGEPSIVVFVQMNIDGEDWWATWHVMEPSGMNKKSKDNRLKKRIKSYGDLKSYNHPSFRKLVKNDNNNDTREYDRLEKEYKAAPYDRKGDATHTMLIKKFNLNK